MKTGPPLPRRNEVGWAGLGDDGTEERLTEADNAEGRNHDRIYGPRGKTERSKTELGEAGRAGNGKVQTPEPATPLRKQM